MILTPGTMIYKYTHQEYEKWCKLDYFLVF